MKRITLLLQILLLFSVSISSQASINFGKVSGTVSSKNELLPYVSVFVVGTQIHVLTDENGKFIIENIPEGNIKLKAHIIGYKDEIKHFRLNKEEEVNIDFDLESNSSILNEIVVTGTKTSKRRTNSAVIVNVLDKNLLKNVTARTLSEGLNYCTGLRVETDCQTCNYSQLRMNGLGGSYSQILINSRPIFSSVMGLYGMDQIPSNMIDRVEVVRGGGSAVYGSSAIGGTVNIITKIPYNNSYEVSTIHSIIDKQTNDNVITLNGSMINSNQNAGLSFFGARRDRGMYDANGDNFSEIPHIKANTFGLSSFFLPTKGQKIELNINSIYEYRYGGEMITKAPHLALQSEERMHNIIMGNINYDIKFDKGSFISYLGAQNTKRRHYTGIVPDEDEKEEYNEHFLNPPYGTSNNTTIQLGAQLNYSLPETFGKNTLTIGSEFVYDKIFDEIEAYSYKTDQLTRNFGAFLQSDWDITNSLNLLIGARIDKHNMVKKMIFNPRVSALYKIGNYTQLRGSWSTGFRAPQAFDTDMHIAFAGGGVALIELAKDLKEERSNSYTLSMNFDKPTEHYIYGFTLEGFYTKLNDAFKLEDNGKDEKGNLKKEKRNAMGSVVKGVTLEARANYDGIIQLETGLTLQKSEYRDPVNNSDELEPSKKYLRAPETYGYYTITYNVTPEIALAVNGVYTGSMILLHEAGAPETPKDRYINTKPFFDNGAKISYLHKMEKLRTGIEFSLGMKNIFNSYQTDFDTQKNRDSNYIYGPVLPRTLLFGIKIKSL